MRSKNRDSFSSARDYAFLLLKFRLRSTQELASRLAQKKFSEPVIKETLAFLKEKGFLDDRTFAQEWLAARLKRPFGFGRIQQELKAKGIPQEIIDSQTQALRENYSEEKIVRQLAENKLARLKDIDSKKAKQRIYTLLIRRGFSAQTVSEVVSQLQ